MSGWTESIKFQCSTVQTTNTLHKLSYIKVLRISLFAFHAHSAPSECLTISWAIELIFFKRIVWESKSSFYLAPEGQNSWVWLKKSLFDSN